MFAHIGIFLQQFQPEREQVVEVHRVRRALAGVITFLLIGDLFGERGKITELAFDKFFDGFVRVGRERKNFVQHVGLRKMFVLLVNLRVGHARLDQILCVVAVEDREIALAAERVRVQPQNPRADGMKRPAPKRAQFVAQQIRNAPHHFAGGLIREGEQQNAIRRNALFQKIRDAINERARLARTRAGDDERRAGRRGDGGQLLFVEFARVVNVQPDFRRERLQDVFVRHGRNYIWKQLPSYKYSSQRFGSRRKSITETIRI